MLRREMWGSIRDPFKEQQMELHSTSHESTLLRLCLHTHTPLDSCHRERSRKEHTQGYHKTTKHYAENFVWYLGFWWIFYTLIISFTLYCFLTWKWEVMEFLVMCSPCASPVILTSSLFPCDFPVQPCDRLKCPPHITGHRKKMFVWPTGFFEHRGAYVLI